LDEVKLPVVHLSVTATLTVAKVVRLFPLGGGLRDALDPRKNMASFRSN
jgi:hypothetical protein